MHHLLAAPAGENAVVSGEVAVGHDVHRHPAGRQGLIDLVMGEGELEIGVAVIARNVIVLAGPGEFDQQGHDGGRVLRGLVLARDPVENWRGIPLKHVGLGNGETDIPVDLGAVLDEFAPDRCAVIAPEHFGMIANGHGQPGGNDALQIAFHGSDGNAGVIVFGGVEGDLRRKIKRLQGMGAGGHFLAMHVTDSGRRGGAE